MIQKLSDRGVVMARLESPKSPTVRRIGLINDPHLTRNATSEWKLLGESVESFRTAIADVNEVGVDFLVLGGDLTHGGRSEEQSLLEETLEMVEPAFFAVPGNHDVHGDGWNESEAFAERYADGSYPCIQSVGAIDVIGLNSASMPDGSLASTWAGEVSAGQLEWLRERLPATDQPIVVVHHNLHAQPEHVDRPPWSLFRIRNAGELRALLARHDVPLVLSAHHHLPAVRRSSVTEVMGPATCSFPQGYLLFEVGPTGTAIYFVPLVGREGMRRAWRHAYTGGAQGYGVAEMAWARLDHFPLCDDRSDR